MILADTSVWVDHFRSGNADLFRQLSKSNILIHPFVVAELAMGSLPDRTRTLATLDRLPHAQVAQLGEVRKMVEYRGLYSRGIGLTDAHLIAAVLLTKHATLWTNDKRLLRVAEDLGVNAVL